MFKSIGDQGVAMVRLQSETIDPGALLSAFCQGRTQTGAIVTFSGLARGEAGAVTVLELQAYPEFTEAKIEAMASEAKTRFVLDDLVIVHRTGRISPGEVIVFVATAAPHRRAAFEAADHLMDYLKSKAPFWKKEHGPDGARWIEPTAQDQADAARWD